MNLLKKISHVILLTLLFNFQSFAQTKELNIIKGNIKSETTGEPVVGATIIYAPGKGTQTDIDGNYMLKLPDSTYTITISYVGFQPQSSKIKVQGKSITLDFKLAST